MAGDAEIIRGKAKDGGEPRGALSVTDKLRAHRLLSAVTILIGVALLVYMICVEGEPGAIPLMTVTLGTGWYLFTQTRIRSHRSGLTRNN